MASRNGSTLKPAGPASFSSATTQTANQKSGLEPGTAYEVTEFIIPPLPWAIYKDDQVVDIHGGVKLENEEGSSFVASAGDIRPANWWIEIRMDETHHWSEGSEIRDFLGEKDGRVHCVYFYNEMEHAYCCEMRPSYWLRHVYDFSSVMLPEKMMDEFDQHSSVDSNDHYFHTTDIDALPDDDKCELGIFGCLGETSEEIEEAVQEAVQGNPNWC